MRKDSEPEDPGCGCGDVAEMLRLRRCCGDVVVTVSEHENVAVMMSEHENVVVIMVREYSP